MARKSTFKGGIHPLKAMGEGKGLTQDKPVREMPVPQMMIIPMARIVGTPAVPLVKKGDRVKKGQVIALSGDSGIATEPQLHLEIRKNAKAVNPSTLLPKN